MNFRDLARQTAAQKYAASAQLSPRAVTPRAVTPRAVTPNAVTPNPVSENTALIRQASAQPRRNDSQKRPEMAHRAGPQRSENHSETSIPAFKKFAARELYCPKCDAAMPVRERELLVLPTGALYDYLCARCGTTLGSRKA